MIQRKQSIFLSIYFTLVAILAYIFIAFPSVDIISSTFFYDSDVGFTYGEWPLFMLMYRLVYVMAALLAAIYIFVLFYIFCTNNNRLSRYKKRVIYLASCLAIGPGLVVNGIFKTFWGRARPFEIHDFAGAADFSPAFYIVDFCQHNCSFISGHAAMGFYPMAFAFLFKQSSKPFFYLLSLGVLSGLVFGGARIMQGQHFASDVVFSGLITFMIYYLLAIWIKPEKATESAKL